MLPKLSILSLLISLSLLLTGCFAQRVLRRQLSPPPSTVNQDSERSGTENIIDPDQFNALYLGHSFGRPFAEQMEDFSFRAGINNHAQHIVFRGGRSGSPQSLWESNSQRQLIQTQLDSGEIDLVIMICCSEEFIASSGTTDQAIWDITEYALAQNSDTRIGLALPWIDFPTDYADAAAHSEITDTLYPHWKNLASRLSVDFPGVDVFTIYHGAAAYELREMYEAGNLSDVTQMTGPKATSLFTDQKGHAGQVLLDTGTLLWLAAIHDVDITTFPPFEEYTIDIRLMAQRILDEQD